MAGDLINSVLFPLRLVMPQKSVKRLGLRTLADDRIREVLPLLRGRVLDMGCGDNALIKAWGHGVGVDVVDWEGQVDVVTDNTAKLSFDDGSFDVVTYLASLNHVPNRKDSLVESFRLLKPGGMIVATMIPRAVGVLCHKLIAHWDPDQNDREMDHKEEWGLNDDQVQTLLEAAGFSQVRRKPFGFLGLNRLFVAEKRV